MSGPVRLNLGCGDKILPGYINVDVALERAGKQPDVNCDIRRLDVFPSDHADEILAVHVIEHFWRWEVADILREWVRVLKPGGRLILECPNLKSACEEFLKNPDQMAMPGSTGQRTMWVFYGDPAWKDPLMVHRWGYTPQSLAQVMHEAGLTNLAQEPAQFKLREPRDMRVAGTKPLPASASVGSDPVKILHWLMPYHFSHPSMIGTAGLASVRLRAGTLLGQLGQRGWAMSAGEEIHPEARVCVIGKIGVNEVASRQPRWMASLRQAKKNGCRLIVDYTDNHLEVRTPMSAFYEEVLELADVFSCSSRLLAQALARRTGDARAIVVIPDAIEVPVVAPKARVSDPVTMLWFGHETNLPYLVDMMESLRDVSTPLRLLALTNRGGISWLQGQSLRSGANVKVDVAEWSVDVLMKAAAVADLCVIPSDPGDARKSGVSENRLITALSLGLPVAASALDSYLAFRDYFVDIESAGFRRMLDSPLDFSGMVVKAQAEVVPRFSREVIAAQWVSLFDRVNSGT